MLKTIGTMKNKKPQETEEDDEEDLTTIQIGNVIIQSKKLSINQLKKNAIDIINDKRVKPYLTYLQRESLVRDFSPSYIG